MLTRTIRCKDCDSMLWSDHAKAAELCPECECVDEHDYSDFEERLEKMSWKATCKPSLQVK